MNAKYYHHLPVILDPAKHNWYILLTVDTFSTWDKDLAEWKTGVSLHYPSSSLPFIAESGSKQAWINNSNLSGSISSINPSSTDWLAQLLGTKGDHTWATPTLDPEVPLSSPPKKFHI
ncbi:hypothetical protein VP01_1169g4 [Puccinia sorghi]|uniref:Uncharacterized protein n=1 Tax=Puccinia sorghi TaxID=27349 RepID=A0A0L6VSS5_9BASI|nr:hypothetical protein VP01_1169g4 [Puccinia sorghi]